MTEIARIVEQFTMKIEGPPPGRDAWFLDYVLRSPKEAGKHLTAGWLAYGSLLDVYTPGDIKTAREFFGGMGAQSLMIQHLFRPAIHEIHDYNEDAVRHIQRVTDPLMRGIPLNQYAPLIQASVRDAYSGKSGLWLDADLVGLDFGDLTVWKTREGEPHRKLLDIVFEGRPKAVVFTDIAARYLHLHRERYETLLGAGTCDSYETYLDALLSRLQELYGYSLVRGYVDRWSTVMALVPSSMVKARGDLVPTPANPLGLELF